MIGLSVFLVRSVSDSIKDYRVVQRNFYGTLRSALSPTLDSGEATAPCCTARSTTAVDDLERGAVCSPITVPIGIGRTMRRRQEGVPAKVGVLGWVPVQWLPSAVLATTSGLKINLVPKLASTEFTFVPDSKAKVEIVMGDGKAVARTGTVAALRCADDGRVLRRLDSGASGDSGGLQ